MRLANLKWENFRRIPDGSIDVRKHLVLVGPNDVGKSSLIRGIHLLIGVPSGQLAQAVGERDFTDPSRALTISARFSDLSTDERFSFPEQVDLTTSTLEVSIEATMTPGDPESLAVQRILPGSAARRGPTRQQLDAFRWIYLPAMRSLLRELGSSVGGTVQTTLSNLDIGIDREAISEILNSLDDSLESASSLKVIRESLSMALSSTLPNDVPVANLHFRTESGLEGSALRGVALTIDTDGVESPINEQSEGIKSIVLQAFLSSSQSAPSILGIDEPEIHLHSLAQRSLATLLIKSQSQLVLATHSAAIVGVIDPLDIVVFHHDRTISQLPVSHPFLNLKSLARHWSTRLLEPLTARKVVLVEGASDRIFLHCLAKCAGINLDKHGISIFELDGYGFFGSAYKFFGPGGFELPISGMIDEDARSAVSTQIGIPPTDLEINDIYVCLNDLEEHYVRQLTLVRTLSILGSAGFSEASIVNTLRLPNSSTLSESDVAEFCRKKKVECALAVGNAIAQAEVPAFQAILDIMRPL